jgi:uncharacterized protein
LEFIPGKDVKLKMKLSSKISLVLAVAVLLLTVVPGCSHPNIQTAPPKPTRSPYQQAVEDLVKNSATYRFDGIDGSLKITTVSSSAEVGSTLPAKDWEFTVEYQTTHPGHGDRSGQMLAQVVTRHTAVVKLNSDSGEIYLANCDKTWDMLNEGNPPISVTGTVISGGADLSDGPQDAPGVIVYEVKKDNGAIIKVSYTAYPPSPVGDANRAKIRLDFAGGAIKIGDTMEVSGRMDNEKDTINVAEQGDYIRTYPRATLPIESENVSWQMGDTEVAATLTRPDDHNIHPAIVFVAGSGPTDRDWNSPLLPGTNGSARLLAEALAADGYITLRYDKRVVGPKAPKNLPWLVGKISMESHLDELAAAVNLLLVRPDVDPHQIFVLANSEGTIHALNYQITRQPSLAGLILVGMPGRNMADLMRAQIEAQLAALPNTPEVMTGYDKLMADFLAEKPFVADPALPAGINNLFQGFNVPINLPFARELFRLNPATLLGQVNGPVLVMIGQKDVQVDFKLDAQPLESAAQEHTNISFVYPENANHVLKYESRPRETLTGADALTYNAANQVLDPDSLRIIKNWLLKNN